VNKRRVFYGWMGWLLVFLAPALGLAQTAPKPAPPDMAVKGAAAVRTTKMIATAQVLEISDTAMKVERTVKGTAEIMEFALEKPVPRIAVGDKVRISYVTREDRLIAVRVYKAAKIDPKKAKKETRPPVLPVPAPPGSGK